MLDTKFAPWPSFTEEEVEAVRHVLESNRVNYWTGGEGRDFEKEFAAFAGTSHAVTDDIRRKNHYCIPIRSGYS